MAEFATVRVSEETKERLRRRKRNDESFNDVITRLLATSYPIAARMRRPEPA
ncbi:hypothetical protein BRC85_00350 [Halobacteriales archaeon QS_1_69_70]|nr:MAG: hypothetical protein BRC85_00350 [Halobacteriales archaeon QS_1_69_70]